MLLKDKICIVVGAASLRSIGYATTELFARHGATVVAVDIAMDHDVVTAINASVEQALQRHCGIIGLKCDIRSHSQCENITRDTLARYGKIDCLVNCAGVVNANPMLEIGEADYDEMMAINLKGTFNMCQAALDVFAEQNNGVIVNVASVAAQRGGGLVGGAHYAASKGGVVSLTRAIAREFGPKGIRTNSVCPSMTETGMLDDTVTPEMFAQIVASIPLQRAGRPSDIAGACLFLASELSAYITGATIDVNGGSHIH